MKDSIYTIPISEVFEPKCGCPLCSLFQTLEERWVDYITGAAMMEPDVRVETNSHGFCSHHFDMMLLQKNRLSVALMLQTRLAWIDENLDTMAKPAAGLFRKEADGETDYCFVCSKIDAEFARIGSNIATVWAREADFRTLYSQQEFLCYPHARLLLDAARTTLRKDSLAEFRQATNTLTRKKLRALKADVDAFCNLFDYRNAGSARPSDEVAEAVERSIAYLTAKPRPSGDEKE
ncbi:DUF6062 family protein [Ruminococcaceae bacterium OttesenSCG-928-L11]|nr:DUF6062 family protein [Ruminococcaceae bacterium OttesenSCG-928-L11]